MWRSVWDKIGRRLTAAWELIARRVPPTPLPSWPSPRRAWRERARATTPRSWTGRIRDRLKSPAGAVRLTRVRPSPDRPGLAIVRFAEPVPPSDNSIAGPEAVAQVAADLSRLRAAAIRKSVQRVAELDRSLRAQGARCARVILFNTGTNDAAAALPLARDRGAGGGGG